MLCGEGEREREKERGEREREMKETFITAVRTLGRSCVNLDIKYLCEKGNLDLPRGLGCWEARRIRLCTLVLQSPTKCIYLTNVTQNSLVADEGLFNGSKTGETFPTFFFFVSVYVSIKKKKKKKRSWLQLKRNHGIYLGSNTDFT